MPLFFGKTSTTIEHSDLAGDMHKIELGDETGLLDSSNELFERLNAINESFTKRGSAFMLYNGIDAYTLSNIEPRVPEIKKVLYSLHNINPLSMAWNVMPEKENIVAINTSSIVGHTEWLVFRINHLLSAAKEAGVEIVVENGDIKLPHVVIRISNDLNLALKYPSMTSESSTIMDRVMGAREKK